MAVFVSQKSIAVRCTLCGSLRRMNNVNVCSSITLKANSIAPGFMSVQAFHCTFSALVIESRKENVCTPSTERTFTYRSSSSSAFLD